MLLPAPPLAEEPAERPLHGLGDGDAFVAGESPGSLDAMFGGLAGAGGQTATQFGQASSRHPQGCGNQFGQGSDLAFPQPDAYTDNPANDFREFPGGSLRRFWW
jgi:hypothetical protein